MHRVATNLDANARAAASPGKRTAAGRCAACRPRPRLLWMYLRLLYTQYALTQFLQKTSDKEIQADINLLTERLKNMPGDAERRPATTRLQSGGRQSANRRGLEVRELSKKPQENHELMGLEIDRLENTIHSLSELAVNRQEPNFISGQIDQVAASMVQTEKTMGELQFVTGLHAADDEAPAILAQQCRRPGMI